MFKALVDDQQLSKTQKMIYRKASVRGTAEKAIAGMFFDGTMYHKAGTHDLEPTTLLCSCNGVFTDRFIFGLNFPRMRVPQETDDQLQEIKLTS